MHIASPNAGEVIQGFSLALKKGIVYDVSQIVSVIFLSFCLSVFLLEVPLHVLCHRAFTIHKSARHSFRNSFYFFNLL